MFNWEDETQNLSFSLESTPIKPSNHITCLGLPIGTSIKHTRQLLLSHIQRRICTAYATFIKAKLRFNRSILATLYNAIVTSHILHCTPFWKIFTQTDKNKIRSTFFRFAKYLLRLPPWTRNTKIIRIYNITDPLKAAEKQIVKFNNNRQTHQWWPILTQ